MGNSYLYCGKGKKANPKGKPKAPPPAKKKAKKPSE